MSLFFKDLIHDLREKKLWPVALALLLAIVAVPLVLLRSGSEAPVADTPVTVPPAGERAENAALALVADDEPKASKLESFPAKDPFRPRGPAAPAPPEQPASGAPAGGAPAGIGGSSTGAGVSGEPADREPASREPAPKAPSAPAAPVSPRTPAARPPAKSKPVLYTYTVDVRFGRRGKERLRRAIERMQPIPNAERPLLVFLGTSASGKSAVFLLDQSLEQRGKGICKPNRRNCSLLYLRLDRDHDLHFFTDAAGRGYALRLVSIDLVPVDEVAKRKQKQADGASRSKSAKDSRPARWPFDAGAFADLAR